MYCLGQPELEYQTALLILIAEAASLKLAGEACLRMGCVKVLSIAFGVPRCPEEIKTLSRVPAKAVPSCATVYGIASPTYRRFLLPGREMKYFSRAGGLASSWSLT